MKKSTKAIGVFIGIVAIIAFLAYQNSHPQSQFTVISEGEEPTHGSAKELQQAPPWTLTDTSGKKLNSSQFQGKVIVISFWTTWCPACKTEIQTLNEVQKGIANQNLQLIGICLNQTNTDDITAFMKALHIRYPILMGNTKVVKGFGNFNIIPATFIIDKKGKIRYYFHGTHSKQRFIQALQPLL